MPGDIYDLPSFEEPDDGPHYTPDSSPISDTPVEQVAGPTDLAPDTPPNQQETADESREKPSTPPPDMRDWDALYDLYRRVVLDPNVQYEDIPKQLPPPEPDNTAPPADRTISGKVVTSEDNDKATSTEAEDTATREAEPEEERHDAPELESPTKQYPPPETKYVRPGPPTFRGLTSDEIGELLQRLESWRGASDEETLERLRVMLLQGRDALQAEQRGLPPGKSPADEAEGEKNRGLPPAEFALVVEKDTAGDDDEKDPENKDDKNPTDADETKKDEASDTEEDTNKTADDQQKTAEDPSDANPQPGTPDGSDKPTEEDKKPDGQDKTAADSAATDETPAVEGTILDKATYEEKLQEAADQAAREAEEEAARQKGEKVVLEYDQEALQILKEFIMTGRVNSRHARDADHTDGSDRDTSAYDGTPRPTEARTSPDAPDFKIGEPHEPGKADVPNFTPPKAFQEAGTTTHEVKAEEGTLKVAYDYVARATRKVIEGSLEYVPLITGGLDVAGLKLALVKEKDGEKQHNAFVQQAAAELKIEKKPAVSKYYIANHTTGQRDIFGRKMKEPINLHRTPGGAPAARQVHTIEKIVRMAEETRDRAIKIAENDNDQRGAMIVRSFFDQLITYLRVRHAARDLIPPKQDRKKK